MSEPIRVLCVFHSLNRGGAESLWMNIYRHIDRAKIQFDFIKHTKEKGVFEDEIALLGGRIYTAPSYYFINQLAYKKWWVSHLKEHPEHLVIHGHYFTISSVYFSVAKKYGRRTIAHSHATENEKPHRWLKDILTSRIKTYADISLACSKPAGEWLFGKGSFTVIKNGIEVDNYAFDMDERESVRKELGIEDSFVIGTIGRFFPQKNPKGIVKIIKKVCIQRKDARLLWVGDGDMMSLAKKWVHDEGIDKAVIFAGVRSDIPRMLSAMDVFILPSNYEGLGIVLIEAQANGLFCLASDKVPSEAKVTEDMEFLPLNYDAWAEKIVEKDKRRTVRDNREIVRKAGFDIGLAAKKMEEIYFGAEDGARLA